MELDFSLVCLLVLFFSNNAVADKTCEYMGGRCIARSESCDDKVPMMAWSCGWNALAWHCCKDVPVNLSEDCGQTSVEAESDDGWRIVNGNAAKPGSWPWQVSLKMRGQHFCGGSIINESWILTAAHCVQSNYAYVDVVVGEHDQQVVERSEKAHRIQVVFLHGQYNPDHDTSPNDIALLKLHQPIRFNKHVQKVCLPKPKVHHDGFFEGIKDCWITGWGLTKGTANSRYLQQLKHRALYQRECENRWGYIPPNTICIGNSVQGACSGDSGGPMVCKIGSKFYQAGVTSIGHRDCQYLPSIYTRVTAFNKWIRDVQIYQEQKQLNFGMINIA